MKRVDTINRKKIDIVSVALALVAVVLIGGWLIISPDKAVENITNVKAGSDTRLSPFICGLVLDVLYIFCISRFPNMEIYDSGTENRSSKHSVGWS